MENKSPKPTAKPGSERIRLLRERRLREGLTELRGVFVPINLHAEAKQVLSKWLKGRSK